MSGKTDTRQKQHFDKIASCYNAHYDDPYSRKYRDLFICKYLFRGIELAGKNVLEAMCGAGEVTEYLISQGAHVTGLDISEEMVRSFQERFSACRGICCSFFENGLEDASFDVVVITGGLHHLQPDVYKAVDEIYRLLKPGGVFCFFEPHAGSLPDVVRQKWMKRDPLFEDNEASIDFDVLQSQNQARFDFQKPVYGGNIAYMLVYSSLILRIPLWLKPVYSPFAMALESLFSHLQGKKLSCYIIGQWQKI